MSDPRDIPARMFTSTFEKQSLTNEIIAAGLDEIARLLPQDLRSHDRRRALKRTGEVIRACQGSVVELVENHGVEGVHLLGIGYELSGVVTDWVRTGRLLMLERLKAQRHEELVRLPSIGPRLAQELRDTLGVVDLEGLAEVAREGRLANVCGFGPKRLKMVTSLLAARRFGPSQSDERASAAA